MPLETTAAPPSPVGATTFDELSARLRALQVWSGASYREVLRRVVHARRERGVVELPVYNTVYRCLRPGRTRLDVELVVDIAGALLGDHPDRAGQAGQWRQAYQVIAGLAVDVAVVSASDTLPADLPEFTGRGAELDRLLALASAGEGVLAISGMPGVGKTTLAVHAAHALGRPNQPCLAVNLRGHDPARPPADPSAVLDAFLRLLGVPGDQIHTMDHGRRLARYRELLAGRPALVVLDNAASEDQVRSLLPGAPGCLVLVTSRRTLAGLDGARHLALDVFTPAESAELVRRASGAEQASSSAEEQAVAERIVGVLGHLPLAVGLVASRIKGRPGWTLTDHLERLEERRAARQLDDGVELALGLSYEDLPDDLRWLFRSLALHPGSDVEPYSAAALAGVDLDAATAGLDLLLAGNLLQRRTPGRYEFHDLVRLYARNRSHDEDPGRARQAARTRLLDHYAFTTARASDRYAPHEASSRPAVAHPGTPAPELPDLDTATAWMDANRPNLVAAAVHATEHGQAEYAGMLSSLAFRYLDAAAHYGDAIVLHTAATQAPDPAVRARALSRLGLVHVRTGRFADAVVRLRAALALADEAGDAVAQSGALGNLGIVCAWLGEYRESAGYFRRTLDLAAASGHHPNEALALGNLGAVQERLGHHEEALELHHAALAMHDELGDRDGAGHALGNIGIVLHSLGRHDEALEHPNEALALLRETGSRSGEGRALGDRGAVLLSLGRAEEALEHHLHGLELLREIGDREGEAEALNGVGAALHGLGRDAEALARHTEALALATELGDRYEQARAHAGIARGSQNENAARAAQALYRDMGIPAPP